MNINDAKNQIKNAMRVYFTKDEFGNYLLPPEQQRPVFLLGPPGIGKTAIIAQIAQEMDIGMLSYSMTHHTRQSALGLPFISRKTYNGKEYDISEYTMSEIIASVYELIEESGRTEGILFLDEINCVSETLAPVMLQFLQYKVFGKHRIPNGWLVVSAGNPPEYNKSVNEFDTVTMDRLKRIDVEPDFGAWKENAYKEGVHPAVMTYLEIKKEEFYLMEASVGGKLFVTPRGWSDLSKMLWLYENNEIDVDEHLVSQYLQKPSVAKSFSIYYDLFRKYKSDYQIEEILSGNVSDEIKDRARAAKFDERLSLVGLLIDSLSVELRKSVDSDKALAQFLAQVKEMRDELLNPDAEIAAVFRAQSEEIDNKIKTATLSSSISADDKRVLQTVQELLKTEAEALGALDLHGGEAAMAAIKDRFAMIIENKRRDATKAGEKLSNVFNFCEEVFPGGQELIILATELTVNPHTSEFIAANGNDAYFRHNKDLLFGQRHAGMLAQLSRIEELEKTVASEL